MASKKKQQPPAPPERLTVEWWPITRPIPYAKNARKLSERAIDTLASSLKEFGWRQPIVCDAKDVIVAGHTRLMAAQALGMTEVPVHVAAGLTPRQVRAYRIFGWGFGRYKFQHEPIFYCHLRGQSDRWFGDKTQSTLWAANKPAANRLHPTMKPIALIERALENSSKARDIVLDLFGGSGSTLIACEKLGRCARLMELDPAYADVIVERWQIYTGKLATLDGDGRTFAEVKTARAGKKHAGQ